MPGPETETGPAAAEPPGSDGPDRRLMLPLGLLAVLAGGLWAFVMLAGVVTAGWTDRIDTALLLALRDGADPTDPLGPAWVEEFGRDVTALGSVGLISAVNLAAVGYLLLTGRWRTAVLLVVAIGGGMLLGLGLKEVFDRPRPDLVPHGTAVFTASFPSAHATMAAATWLTLGALLARVQSQPRVRAYVLGLAMVVTLAVGISRVYLGVHWPSDVLAGWALGAAWAVGVWLVARRLIRRRDRSANPS